MLASFLETSAIKKIFEKLCTLCGLSESKIDTFLSVDIFLMALVSRKNQAHETPLDVYQATTIEPLSNHLDGPHNVQIFSKL